MFPERAGARGATNEIFGTDVQTLADVTVERYIMVIRVAEIAPAAGKELSDNSRTFGSRPERWSSQTRRETRSTGRIRP